VLRAGGERGVRYKDALVSLATELLHKLQFRYNQSQLDELDDDVLDDDVRITLACLFASLSLFILVIDHIHVLCRFLTA